MADTYAGIPVPSSPGSMPGTGALVVRKDKAADLAGTNAYASVPQVDAYGALRVSAAGGKPTYSGSFVGLVGASSCTDLVTIAAGAQTVELLEIRVSGVATAAAFLDAQIIKRSTLDTLGTKTAATAVPHSSDNAAATATVNGYTANPTVGTAVATAQVRKLTLGKADTTGVLPVELVFDFRSRVGEQPLRIAGGGTELVALNLNATSPGSGNLIDVTVVWAELPATA